MKYQQNGFGYNHAPGGIENSKMGKGTQIYSKILAFAHLCVDQITKKETKKTPKAVYTYAQAPSSIRRILY